ncbi:CPBP family intramembrane metalloprotease [Patescibacteria group bacterium]|nr:CPBP family intramembrane metalloprotease [Patescibacteria group bacterium]MBU0777409.1 CPBP family intramembrane metalloprotease [Patescibacteria group bacterium]MBU0846045.1 CPBP family intramembrane metalloprotease [Patescibacteria group bacterium]MBU0922455.1 CPBP family intramembrane metalloprotease [Patescibacteria group bacterium]MBU1066812.1 CPBP family intramembrane metalloprotease [Patescibacteria group bacterium]
MPKKEAAIKHATILAAYLLVVWGFYRLLFKLPEEIEELIIKPIVWLLPVIYLVKKEGGNLSSVGITIKKLFPAIYFTLALGAVFAIEAIIINFVKYGGFEFTANIGEKALLASLGISFVTAFSEEVSFRGYLFNRVWGALNNEWLANITTSVVWALVHVPVVIFVWKLSLISSLVYLFLTALFGVGSAFVFARTRNVFSSILLHILWQWPIILFR